MRGCLVVMNGPACSGKTTLAKQLQSALCLQFAHRAPDTLGRTHTARVWHMEFDRLEQHVRTSKAKQVAQQSEQQVEKQDQEWSKELWKKAQKLALETACAILEGAERCPKYDSLTRLVNPHVSCKPGVGSDAFFDFVLVDDNMLKRSSRKKYSAVALENEFVFMQLCLQAPLDVCVARNSVRNKLGMRLSEHGQNVAETKCQAAQQQQKQQSLVVPDAVVQDTHTFNEVRQSLSSYNERVCST